MFRKWNKKKSNFWEGRGVLGKGVGAIRTGVGAFVLGLTLSGCLTAPVYTLPVVPDPLPCLSPARTEDTAIGLAVSGGGSRAALFAAGAFEALAQLRVGAEGRGLLDQVSYISSVSGGSLASAYYVLKKPGHEVPMLDKQGELTQAYREFFYGFKEAMAQDYEGPLLRRNLLMWRWVNPAFVAKSLIEILQEDYFGKETFGALADREMRGDAPRLMVNTTLYNDGRRFLLSTLPRKDLRFDWAAAIKRSAAVEMPPDAQALIRNRAETLNTMTPQDLHLNICETKVASAVVGSMSFPPIIGPISLMDEKDKRYWHVGDGGMSDNTGAESLVMMLLRNMEAGSIRKALIVSIDSSFPFDVGGEALDKRKDAFSLFNYDYSRIPSIMEERSLAYRSLFLRVAQQLGIVPGPDRIAVFRLRHTEAQWAQDLSDLPDSCKKDKVNWKSPKDVGRHLAGIVTRLWIESTCDRDLVLLAATKVITQNEGKIRTFLEASPSH
ncbi:patatin-like phospholipase family protein [Petrachloros mirabilis]